jgi:hypothetical protein
MGSLVFADATALLASIACAQADVRGAEWVDVDDDGDPDLFVADNLNGNHLWRNDRVGGRSMFTEITSQYGLGSALGGRTNGFDWGDFDGDGDLDPLLARYGGDTTSVAYNAIRIDSSIAKLDSSGIRRDGLPSGAAWGDIDNDGRLDIFIGAGSGCRYADVYVQKPTGVFDVKTFAMGLAHRTLGPDGTWIDIDNDGRLDLATAEDGLLRIFRNTMSEARGYVAFDLVPTKPGVEGARVTVMAGGRMHTGEIHAGRGLLMQDPSRVHIGLYQAPALTDVVVSWPSGTPARERFPVTAINQLHTLRQGEGDEVR